VLPGKATLEPDTDTLPRELKMNERHVLCAIGAQSGFMYVGREVFDEIVASARQLQPYPWSCARTFDLSAV